MASKPFGIQSPEQIAKDYGGNKQRIAEAMQLGIVDPTIGTLAGMFIDRMAAGAAQGQAPQGTIASQVFDQQTPAAQAPGGAGPGGLPPVPSAPPMGPPPPDMSMGMGAPPPDMPMPPQSPEDMQPMSPGMADGGMVAFARGGESRPLDLQSLLPFPEAGLPEGAGFADGGVASLPVPDDMFNSSVGDNQQYADGGMVAFAEGGTTYGKFRNLIIERESGGNYAARNKQSGAMGKYQVMPDTARALAKRLGMEYNPALMTSNTEAGRAYQDAIGNAAIREAYDYGRGDMAKAAGYYQGGPNTRIHGVENRRYQEAIARGMGQPMARRATLAAATPRTATAAPAPPAAPTTAPAGLAAAAQGGSNEETRAMYDMMQGEATQRNKDRAADKKDRRQAAFMALAQQGLAMMSPEGAGMPSLFADGGVVRFAAGTPPNDPFSLANQQAEMAKQEQLAPPNREFYNMRMASIREDLANERTDRKQAANMALMNFGLALMASKNPNFLGAVGESGAPAAAGMKADLRDLKKEARATIMDAAQLEDYDNKGRRSLADAATAQITRVVEAQTQASQFETKEQNDMIRSREQIAAQRDIADARERAEERRFNTEIELARAKSPYELETRTLKDDNGDERLVQIRTNKNTGEVHQYSMQVGDYIKPEYALAMNKPGVKERLDVLLPQMEGAIHVGVDGRMYLQRGNSPGMNPIKPSWLESLATSPDANK